MRFFAKLGPVDPQLGGKARSLARLAAAGCVTPSGFVVTDALFRELLPGLSLPTRLDAGAFAELDAAVVRLTGAPWPVGFLTELEHRLAALGASSFAVRSSFLAEDDATGLAAGVYESRVDVAADAVPAALRGVLGSAISPAAIAYAAAHGIKPAAPPVAVLVHAFVKGDAAGVAAFDPYAPRAPAPVIETNRAKGQLSASFERRLAGTLQTLAAAHGPVEVEWVASGESLCLLQLRPYQAPAPRRAWKGHAELPAGESAAAWRWDAAHNPLPLSPAQQGLVALVDARCRIGIRQLTLAGYLFWSAAGSPAPATISPSQAADAFRRLRVETEGRLLQLGPTPTLEAALDLFVSVYEPLLGVVQPAARRGRQMLADFLHVNLPAAVSRLPILLGGVESLAQERRRRADAIASAADPRDQFVRAYLDLFGDESPAWDVAVPTFRERSSGDWLSRAGAAGRGPGLAPTGPNWQAEASQILSQLPRMARRAWKDLLPTARACAGICEDDDWLYARVAAPVRRALCDLGARLAREDQLHEADDVFFLPFERARELAAGVAAGAEIRALATAGRRAHQAALAAPPPAPDAGLASAGILRGRGTGGRALGRVFLHHRGDGRTPPAGAILVATSLLPTELPLLAAAALVTETGGALDHVAAQARERQLPAVVGVAGAVAALTDGDLVLVDADRGLVIRLGPAES